MLLRATKQHHYIGLVITLTVLSIILWHCFPTIGLQLLQLQRKMLDVLYEYSLLASQRAEDAALLLMGFSFIYGLIHSISPGHGKTAIISMSLLKGYRRYTAIALVVAIALLQAYSAITLFMLSHYLIEYFALSLVDTSRLLTQACALLIITLACKELFFLLLARFKPQNETEQHSQPITWHSLLLIGLRPCTGAIFVLLLASSLSILSYGIISIFFMAAGTAITNALLVFNALSLPQKLQQTKGTQYTGLKQSFAVLLCLVMILSGLILFNLANVTTLFTNKEAPWNILTNY